MDTLIVIGYIIWPFILGILITPVIFGLLFWLHVHEEKQREKFMSNNVK